jgi:hypothetical protein
MANPFPGMNPFLENRTYWRNFHQAFIAEIYRELNRLLPLEFAATMDERLYITYEALDEYSILPDVTVLQQEPTSRNVRGGTVVAVSSRPTDRSVDSPLHIQVLPEQQREIFIEIRSVAENALIAVIELLSPTNKRPESEGWDEYRRKQYGLLGSDVHFIEIDLLRGGNHTVAVPEAALRQKASSWDYLVCLHRAGGKGSYFVWAFGLRDSLPCIMVPLTEGQPEIPLDLHALFQQCWDEGPFERIVRFDLPIEPPLSPEDAQWVAGQIPL